MIRIPTVSYDPLRRALGYGYQIERDRLNDEDARAQIGLQRQAMALQWARFGLDSAKAIFGIVEMYDQTQLQKAKLEYARQLDSFIADRVARNDFAFVEEYKTSPDGTREFVGKRPNWEQMFLDFEANFPKPSFILGKTSVAFQEYKQDISRSARVKMVDMARQMLEQEALKAVNLSIQETLKRDIESHVGDPKDIPLRETVAVIDEYRENGTIRPIDAAMMEATLRQQAIPRVIEHRVNIALEHKEYDLAQQIIQKYLPEMSREQASLLANRVQTSYEIERSGFLKEFYEKFPVGELKIDYTSALSSIEASPLRKQDKLELLRETQGRWETKVNEWFKGRLNTDRFSREGLLRLLKDVRENPEYGVMRYLQDAHLDEITSLLGAMDRAGGGKTESPEERELVLRVTRFREGYPGDTYEGIFTAINKALSSGIIEVPRYRQLVGDLTGYVGDKTKKTVDLFIGDPTRDDRGRVVVAVSNGSGTLKGAVPPEAVGRYYDSVTELVKGGKLDKIDEVTENFWTSVIKEKLGKVPVGALSQKEVNWEGSGERMDKLWEAILNGAGTGVLFFSGGSLRFSSEAVKQTFSTLWSEATRMFESATGLNNKKYSIYNTGEFVRAPGDIAFVNTDDSYVYVTRVEVVEGNAVLAREKFLKKDYSVSYPKEYYNAKARKWGVKGPQKGESPRRDSGFFGVGVPEKPPPEIPGSGGIW